MSASINKQTLPEQIYNILRADILNQEIKCGQKLTLQSLRDRFGVSHTPIREALTRLVEDNLVTYYSNVGISVVSLDAQDIREIFELSYDLDCLGLKYAFECGHGPELLEALRNNIAECNKLLDEGNTAEWCNTSDNFHLAFYKYAGNSRLNRAAFKLRAQTTLLYRLYKIENKSCNRIQNHHNDIYMALTEADMESAFCALKQHLKEDMDIALKIYQTPSSFHYER